MEASNWSLAPLSLEGAGTGDLESNTSLITRSAEHHSVLGGTLVRQLILRDPASSYKKRPWATAQHPFNGYGVHARLVAKRLGDLMGMPAPAGGSMTPWAEMLNPMGHDLLHEERHYCRPCMREDIAKGRSPFHRLYWSARPVRACVHHRVQLEHKCPGCDRKQGLIPSLPYLHICQHCGTSLIQADDSPEIASSADWWRAASVHELIARSQGQAAIPHRLMLQWLKTLCSHYGGGSPWVLAKRTGLDVANLKRWLSGEAKPNLGVLIDFCAALRCSPASIVTGQPHLAALELSPDLIEKRKPRQRRIRKPTEIEKMRLSLERALSGGYGAAPSLKEMARRLDCGDGFLLWKFPALAKKVKKISEKRRREQYDRRHALRLKQAAACLERLAKKGIYPSDRHLRSVGATQSMLINKSCKKLFAKERRAHRLMQ